MLDHTREAAPPTSAARLESVERILALKFPESYRTFLLTHNGGRPVPADIAQPGVDPDQWMRIHFFFGIDDDVQSCDLLWNWEVVGARLPKSVLPIANDEVGNRFCLDLRHPHAARVLFWDHELEHLGPARSLTTVAASFDDLLDRLADAP
jgi:cell wall assembly regulator SMI1